MHRYKGMKRVKGKIRVGKNAQKRRKERKIRERKKNFGLSPKQRFF